MGKFHEWLGDELSLYARQLAWLSAIPKVDKKLDSQVEPVSRIEQIRADGLYPHLPPLSAPQLIEYLMEAGPTIAAGMGAAPIGWQDISAWAAMVGVELPPWQARLLRRLSRDYLGEWTAAAKPDCPPPYAPDLTSADHRAVVDAKVRSILGGRVRT